MKDLNCHLFPVFVAIVLINIFMILFTAIQIVSGVHLLIAIGTSGHFCFGIAISFIVNFNRYYLVRFRNHRVVMDRATDPASFYNLAWKLYLLPFIILTLCFISMNRELNQAVWKVPDPAIAIALFIACGIIGLSLNIWTTKWVFSMKIEPPIPNGSEQ